MSANTPFDHYAHREHAHDHAHEQLAPDHDDEGPPSDYEIMSRAMQELLEEKGVINADEIRRRMETFSGQGFFAHRWVVSDQVIVGNGYFSGAPTGEFFGVPATGRTLLLPMSLWIYFEDTLVKGEASYLDGAELQRQLREGATGDIKDPVF